MCHNSEGTKCNPQIKNLKTGELVKGFYFVTTRGEYFEKYCICAIEYNL